MVIAIRPEVCVVTDEQESRPGIPNAPPVWLSTTTYQLYRQFFRKNTENLQEMNNRYKACEVSILQERTDRNRV